MLDKVINTARSQEIEKEFLNLMDRSEKLIVDGWVKNKDELVQIMHDLVKDDLALRYYLKASLEDQTHRVSIGAQSFLLHSSPVFASRLNLWYPKFKSIAEETQTDIDRYFSIEMPHNHNYDFFTIGVLGPGYRTKYVVTDEQPNWKVGDVVNIIDEFELTLSRDVSMFVPKDTHFHNQMSPEALSVSLNIIPTPKISTKQYALKQDLKTINRVFDVTEAMRTDPKRLMT